jgi:PAS domain-containing protein
MTKKHLAIIALDQKTLNHLIEILDNIIGEEIKIDGYSLDKPVLPENMPDLVLVSGHFLLEKAQDMFPGRFIIVGERVVTGSNLESLMLLPAGTRVLVVSYFKYASDGTIEALKALGLNHLHYESFWQEKKIDVSKFDVAISAGMIHLCPMGIEKRINIGERGLSANTFCQILLYFKLDTKYLNKFQEVFYRKYFEPSKKIKFLLEESEKISNNQNAIISKMDEGVLVLNEKSQVLIANQSLQELFGKEKDLLSNKTLQNVLKCFRNYINSSMDDKEKQAISVNVDDYTIYCNMHVINTGKESNYFYIFKKIENNQVFKNYKRLKTESKGYTAKYTFDDLHGENLKLYQIKEKAKKLLIKKQ